MDDFHVISNQENEMPRKSSAGKIVALSVLLVLATTAIGGGAYYFGKRSVKATKTEASISQTVQVQGVTSEPIVQPTPTVLPTTSVSATPSKTSPTPSASSKTALITSAPTLDGYVGSTGTVFESKDIEIGRNANSVMRGFVSFSTSSLPQGVQIAKATLRIYQKEVKGSPFSGLGAIKVDHLTYGDSLDKDDYARSALSSGFVTIAQGTNSEWKEIDVTSKLKDDLSNARSYSQYRIHFTTEKTAGSEDIVIFESAENTAKLGNAPQLVVSY